MGDGASLTNTVLELRGVWCRYGGEYVLKNVGLEVRSGEFVCVRGRSGVGKTTLAKVAALILRPERGKVFFKGIDATDLSDRVRSGLRLKGIGYIPQSLDLIDQLTVIENIELPMAALGVPKKVRRAKVLKLMELLGLSGLEYRYPNELSGGQQQRVAIARALVNDPVLIVADEPFSNLDESTTAKVLSLLRTYLSKGTAIVMTTTELSTPYPCNKDYILENGDLRLKTT
ncbi:MAG TPA: ABC transporter ATP-binding protein [Acidilobales archaeon]|nr:ABC transporter ATP-binding protein [Acidilobales archaeon]